MSQQSHSTSVRVLAVAMTGIALAALAGVAISAQDKYTLQVPNGLAFSEFKGYETWELVSASGPLAPGLTLNAAQAPLPNFPDLLLAAKLHLRRGLERGKLVVVDDDLIAVILDLPGGERLDHLDNQPGLFGSFP